MCWLRTPLPEFSVRSAESVPSPCCGERLKVIGSRLRCYINNSSESVKLNIRRLRCVQCDRIHHELPDLLVPYKRYDAESIEKVVTCPAATDVPVDESTLHRWNNWVHTLAPYWLGCLASIARRYGQDPVIPSSKDSQSALHRIGQVVGNAIHWLARVVRPITNMNLWIHTRSAFLSKSS
jgi:hypothetical protein